MADRVKISDIGKTAKDTLAELLGCPAEGVIGVRKNKPRERKGEDGSDDGWIVTVEVLEVGRVPETSDVLASYDVHVDQDGDVVEYERVRRYLRAQVED